MDQKRPETGVLQFGDDWPGVFIRGDDAFFFMAGLNSLLQTLGPPSGSIFIQRRVIEGLIELLGSCDVRTNPAPQHAQLVTPE